MTACGSLKHIFENPLPEKNPSSLIASLSSWKQQITPPQPDHHSFTELFGEFHYKDNTTTTQLLSSSPSAINGATAVEKPQSCCSMGSNPINDNNRVSQMNSNSLELCTEGLGSESLDDGEYLNKGRRNTITNNNNESSSSSNVESCSTATTPAAAYHTVVGMGIHHHHCQYRRSARSWTRTAAFPPPISCIGRSGKPWVYFKSYRHDGRFVLQEVRIPTQEEFLHASREDGRLRLRFVQPECDLTDTDEEKEEQVSCKDEEQEIKIQ